MEGPANELIKLAQLYAGQRLEAGGGLVPLSEGRVPRPVEGDAGDHPQEFTLRDQSALDWRVEQLEASATSKNQAGVALHRRWLSRSWRPRIGGPQPTARQLQ